MISRVRSGIAFMLASAVLAVVVIEALHLNIVASGLVGIACGLTGASLWIRMGRP